LRKIFSAVTLAILAVLCFASTVPAQSPLFDSIVITGEAGTDYDRVSLFENGSSETPLKTEDVSSDGSYRIEIRIPEVMQNKGAYYITDMRFWKDANDNGIRDEGDSFSQCHFVRWIPRTGKISFEIYGGAHKEITSSRFTYDLKDPQD
jgi:hypothetical protein